MTERGLPVAQGASACPFVAFEDDRDERATVPDHRHRCYAETRPAPRALAHQEAYCLSSSFPVCPTFQDWARREAARARAATAAAETAAGQRVAASVAGSGDGHGEEPASGVSSESAEGAERAAGPGIEGDPDDESRDGRPRRNPPRDWAAPPPWLASAEAANRDRGDDDAPTFLARRAAEPGQGLVGSAADQLAGGPSPSEAFEARRARPELDPGERSGGPEDRANRDGPDDERGNAPRPRRPRAYAQHLGGTDDGPDWERPRRYEAYPTIRTRVAMPNLPRLAVLAAAVAIAAVALFFLPTLLGSFGGGQPAASPSASVSSAPSLAVTPSPAPTQVLYTIRKNETLLKIATAHGLTLEQLLAANPDIKDPNKVKEGQQIVIPSASEGPGSQSGSPSAAP